MKLPTINSMFFKPRWYKLLPDSVKPIDDNIIKKIEDWRKGYLLTDEMIFMGIMVSRWAVKKVQKFCLEKFKRLMPDASEHELWKSVLLSRFEVKLRASAKINPLAPPETDPFAKPLSPEEILSRIENIDNIVSGFKSFDDVLDYIIKMDEEENRFFDPSGIQDELNNLLET